MAARRTWLAFIAGLSAVVLVIVARLLVTTSGHSTRPTSTAPSVFESPLHTATSLAASPNISIDSSAPAVSLPSNGYYLCPSKGIAICSDQGGDASATTLATGELVYAPTLSRTSRSIYFRQTVRPSLAANPVETIQRVSMDGGPSTTIVTAPPYAGDEGVGLGAPQVSPDGRYLAYVLTVGVLQPPSSPGPSHALALPDPLGAQIFILNIDKPSAPAIAVPMAMTGANLPDGFNGYTLVGWAPDDSRLYYYGGPRRDLETLSLDAVGQPVGVETVVRTTTQQGCADGTPNTAMTPSGDVLFTDYCHQQAPSIDRLHDGSVSVFASLPQLTGKWLTQDLIVDTTGRRVQLDAQPWSPDCVSGEATITFLDGKVIDQQIETQHNGCPPGALAVPAT
jgi:hypothetical protein